MAIYSVVAPLMTLAFSLSYNKQILTTLLQWQDFEYRSTFFYESPVPQTFALLSHFRENSTIKTVSDERSMLLVVKTSAVGLAPTQVSPKMRTECKNCVQARLTLHNEYVTTAKLKLFQEFTTKDANSWNFLFKNTHRLRRKKKTRKYRKVLL